MALSLRRRREPSSFERAADGSMTLIEHIRELRKRLFLASLGIVAGLIVGFIFANDVFELLKQPYCKLPGNQVGNKCATLFVLSPTDVLILKLKLALWLGLIVGGPVWLYQLWAFVAPGLHRHERKWAYAFVAIAAPLFMAGAALAYFVVDKGLAFLIQAGVGGIRSEFEANAYIGFVTSMILIFGVAFEFPLLLLMLNFAGVATGRQLLSWWRTVVFVCFAFAAVATPDPGPFGMILLASSLAVLYFVAVGVAVLNDRRRGRGREVYAGLDDDEVSPLDFDDPDPAVGAPDRIEVAAAVPAPLPLDRRYDDTT